MLNLFPHWLSLPSHCLADARKIAEVEGECQGMGLSENGIQNPVVHHHSAPYERPFYALTMHIYLRFRQTISKILRAGSFSPAFPSAGPQATALTGRARSTHDRQPGM
jgi:hypothetical protein